MPGYMDKMAGTAVPGVNFYVVSTANLDGTLHHLGSAYNDGTGLLCDFAGHYLNDAGTYPAVPDGGALCDGGLLPHSDAPAPAVPDWHLISHHVAPFARYGPGMSWDAARSQWVLYGGHVVGVVSTTYTRAQGADWVLQGMVWPNAPRDRVWPSMVYDPAHSNTLVFGGDNEAGAATTYWTDTWTWNGTSWTDRAPAHAPVGRSAGAIAYDGSALVLFGGVNAGGNQNDTWTWNGTDWTQRSPAHSPPARAYAGMTFDPIHNYVLMFGGYDTAPRNDTWTWNGTDWTEITVASPPLARYLPGGMAYNGVAQAVTIFGGYNAGCLSTSFTWTGSAWVAQTTVNQPMALYATGMASGGTDGRISLTGGWNNDIQGWTWELY